MSIEEFMSKLGGRVVGRVVSGGDGYHWSCECGEVGTADSERKACLGLYFHRRGHA